MIPKIIHYCWFGGKEKPADVLKMIDSWKRNLPDYEIMEWNESNFDITSYRFAHEAHATGNYAYVADVARLKALYDYGGVYLDTDIEVLKSFDPYLDCHSFCGAEHKWVGCGVIGAEKGSIWIKKFLDFYANRRFINWCGHTVRVANTKLLTLKVWPSIHPCDTPFVYEKDVFCAKDWSTGEYFVTENTVCIHHYACSWTRKKKPLKQKIVQLINGLKIRYFNRLT